MTPAAEEEEILAIDAAFEQRGEANAGAANLVARPTGVPGSQASVLAALMCRMNAVHGRLRQLPSDLSVKSAIASVERRLALFERAQSGVDADGARHSADGTWRIALERHDPSGATALDPTDANIERAMSDLAASESTGFMLSAVSLAASSEERRLRVFGGDGRLYVCDSSEGFLVDPRYPWDETMLQRIENGQTDEFPRRWGHPQRRVLRAALHFAATAECLGDEIWEYGTWLRDRWHPVG